MILLKKILCILFIFACALSAQDKCKADVSIETNKDESAIFIDSIFVGNKSIDTLLNEGSYEVVILESISKWGSEVSTEILMIDNCESDYDLTYDFNGTILITSDPNDVAVSTENSLLGYTPLKLRMKNYDLKFSKPGYGSKSMKLNSNTKQKNVSLNFTGMKEGEPFSESTLFKVLIGSAVALGATAAYFKLEADDKFDKYLLTRQQKYLDDTDQLDLYSGIAFGALQLNFGALLYFFLTE